MPVSCEGYCSKYRGLSYGRGREATYRVSVHKKRGDIIKPTTPNWESTRGGMNLKYALLQALSGLIVSDTNQTKRAMAMSGMIIPYKVQKRGSW